MPKRIQRRRVRGWRMPPGAKYVGRGSKWGNPYRIGTCLIPDAQAAVEAFAANLPLSLNCDDLRGKDLACWCRLCPEHADGLPLGVTCEACAPCHADPLLRAANVP